MAKSLIVWLFLNRSSCSLTIFCRLSSVSMCRMIFVFCFLVVQFLNYPANPIPARVGCFCSQLSVWEVFFCFFRFHFNHGLTLELYWIFIHVYKAFCGFVYFRCIDYRRYYRYWRASVNNVFYWLSLDQ